MATDEAQQTAQHQLVLQGITSRLDGEYGALFTRDTLDHYVQDSRDRAHEGQQDIVAAADPPIPEERVHLIEGDARDLLPRFARGQGFDLVVMGSLGREGLAGELLGETAELVVRALRSSVVTLSPRSRSTP